MSRDHHDSATLAAMDCTPAGSCGCSPGDAKAKVAKRTRKDKAFSDPGHEHGASIKCPDIYEALRRKGYSKEKAARISNSRC